MELQQTPSPPALRPTFVEYRLKLIVLFVGQIVCAYFGILVFDASWDDKGLSTPRILQNLPFAALFVAPLVLLCLIGYVVRIAVLIRSWGLFLAQAALCILPEIHLLLLTAFKYAVLFFLGRIG